MPKKPTKMRVMPLGGLQEIGKNMTLIECKDEIVIIDCGLSFPEEEMLGIDIVIPDITYLVKNQEKIKGIVLTHGHEDHIGAIPYFLKKIQVPLYATPLTMGLIELKLQEHRIKNTPCNIVRPGSSVKVGGFTVEFIRVNHSIPEACAIAVTSSVGTVFHTGDFKVDFTPIDGNVIDLHRLAQIGQKGVLLMIGESTNVERPGYTPSESMVGKSLVDIFAEHSGARVIIATFASNIHRVQQIINVAHQNNRKVAFSGRSMLNVSGVARNLGYLQIPENTLIDIKEINRYQDHELVIITTGSQGEPMSALTRIASGEHRQIEARENDLIIFSSHPIPGNEKFVSRVINQLYERGAQVIYDDRHLVHVSGHAHQEEIKLIHAMIKPRFFAPIHGEYRHIVRHLQLAQAMGMKEEDTFVLTNGAILELDQNSARLAGKIPSGNILVDGLGVGDVGSIVLRDRKLLSEDGLMVVSVTIDRQTKKILQGPDVISRGFVYVRESESLMEEVRQIVRNTLEGTPEKGQREWYTTKNSVRDVLRNFLFEKTKRNPMILPIITEV